MKNKLTNNLGIKLLALLISFSLWLVVVNYDDPVSSYTFSGIKVEIINADSLTDLGMVYDVLNNTDTISVTVSGKRSVIDSISKENIVAVADLSELTIMNTVEIRLSTNKNFSQLDSIKSDTSAVELNIENLKIENMSVNVVVDGTPADGYLLGDVTTNQNTVRISGPESLVSRVASAQCSVSVEGRTSDIFTAADIVLLDENGEVVEGNNLTTNIRSLNVSAQILTTKAVELAFSYSGTPADGYVIRGELQGDKNAVYIAGKSSVLDSISVLNIPATAINVDGKNSTYTTTIDISRYLPDGVIFADDSFDGKVAVTINVEKTVTRYFNVPVNNISIVGANNITASLYTDSEDVLAGGTDVSADTATISIVAVGVSDDFTGITGSTIEGYIDIDAYMQSMDVASLADGIYTMEVTFDLPEGITLSDTYYVDVKIGD